MLCVCVHTSQPVLSGRDMPPWRRARSPLYVPRPAELQAEGVVQRDPMEDSGYH